MKVSVILDHKGSDVLSISPEKSLRNTLKFFQENQIGCAPVVDAYGKTLGLITERDICNEVANIGEKAVNKAVGDGLNDFIVCCSPEDRLPKVMALMTSHRARHVLVRNDETTVGIISIGDIVKHRLDEAIQDEKALREYIAGTGYSVPMDA